MEDLHNNDSEAQNKKIYTVDNYPINLWDIEGNFLVKIALLVSDKISILYAEHKTRFYIIIILLILVTLPMLFLPMIIVLIFYMFLTGLMFIPLTIYMCKKRSQIYEIEQANKKLNTIKAKAAMNIEKIRERTERNTAELQKKLEKNIQQNLVK